MAELHGGRPTLRFVCFCVLCVAVVACEADWLFAPPKDRLPLTGGIRRLSAFGDGAPVSQAFLADVPMLTALQVRFLGNATADVEWEVYDIPADAYLALGHRAVAVRGQGTFEIPVPPSPVAGHWLRVTLRRTGETPVPLALAVSGVNSYPGPLTVNGREELSDLALTAIGRSTFAGLLAAQAGRFGALRSPIPLALMFTVATWALLTFVYFMVFAEEEHEN